MKIAILSTSSLAHNIAGTEIHADTVATAAVKTGHEVFLITTAHPNGIKNENRNGYSISYLEGTSPLMSRAQALKWWLSSFKKIQEYKTTVGLDCVWASNLAGQFYAKKKTPDMPPLISIIQGPGMKGEIKSKFNECRNLNDYLFFFTKYQAIMAFSYIPWYRNTIKGSDGIVAVSDQVYDSIKKDFPEAIDKTRIIYNPVDTSIFSKNGEMRLSTRRKLGLKEKEKLFLMTGVAYPQKGFHIGIKAFKKVAERRDNVKLLIAGDGPQLKELKEMSIALGIAGKTSFVGTVENRDMPLFYNAADIYLNPTVRHEGIGIVILEAMACGLPCVVSKIGGTASTITEGENGFFTKPGDADEMAEKALFLLTHPDIAEKFSKSAILRIKENFRLEKIIKEYIDFSEKPINAKKPR